MNDLSEASTPTEFPAYQIRYIVTILNCFIRTLEISLVIRITAQHILLAYTKTYPTIMESNREACS